MRVLTCAVPPAYAGRTVRAVLLGELRLSKSLLQHLKWQREAILRNGAPVPVRETVAAGDELRVLLTERRPPSPHVAPCGVTPEVLYEDRDLLVLNKPAGISMHSAGDAVPTLAGALRGLLEPDEAVHFVNRLDKGTSGLCIAARSGYVHDRFRAALHTGALYREYRAWAEGRVSPDAGVIDFPIGPTEDFFRRQVRPDGQAAVTEYRVLSHGDRYTLLRLVPRTGRTHQLRVHLSALGHPLVGDTLYGAPAEGPMARPALHSYFLRFTHPLTGAELCFTAPLPEDMAALDGL